MVTIKSALVVADAGPLIHLDELSALDVLSDYAAIFVPNAVWLEVLHHRPQALQAYTVKLGRQLAPTPTAKVDALSAVYTLHHGEREALELCLNHCVNTLLSDDSAARLAAKSLNIATHGTVGLLVRAARQHLCTPVEILALLKMIPQQTTLHIRTTLLDEIIEQVKFEWKLGSTIL